MIRIDLLRSVHHCATCKSWKPKKLFTFHHKYKRPLRVCKACQRTYYLANKEKIQAQKTAKRRVAREQTNAANRVYYNKNKDSFRQKDRERYAASTEYKNRVANYGLKRRYGMKREDYDAMLEKQNRCCAICKISQDALDYPLYIDHDHKCCPQKSCGQCVRGLLCRGCNAGIGQLKDDPQIIRAAADYLSLYGKRIIARTSLSGD